MPPRTTPSSQIEQKSAREIVNEFFTQNQKPLTGVVMATQNDKMVFDLIKSIPYREELAYLFDKCVFPIFQYSNEFDDQLYTKVVIEFSRRLRLPFDGLPCIVFFDSATEDKFAHIRLQGYDTPTALRVMRDICDHLNENKEWSLRTLSTYNRNFWQVAADAPRIESKEAESKIIDTIVDFVAELAVKIIVGVAKPS